MYKFIKEYYLKHNGAKINLCCFEIDEYEYEISEIIPLKYGSCSLEKVKENDIEDGFIKESLVPIANNRGGDYYYWDKETEEVYLIYGDDIENPIFICDSISELLKIMSNCN